jgi:transposase InsO family protein
MSVQKRLKEAGFILNETKCVFRQRQVNYLGHTISMQGVQPNGDKVQAISSISPPTNAKEVQSFLGMANYYRRFIKKFADIAQPLYELTQRGTDFLWGQKQSKAFDDLRESLTTCPVLQFPNSHWKFCVATDASNTGLGATLSQIDESGSEYVVAYLSRSLTLAERNLSTIEKECLAIVWTLSKWRHYLLGRHFTILCDHKPLQWLKSMKDNNGKLSRWAMKLAEYDFSIKHISGAQNNVPDALSRLAANQKVIGNILIENEMSLEQISMLQNKDAELAPIIFQKTRDFSASEPIGISRRYKQLWGQLEVMDNVLYRQVTENSPVIVVPRILRPKVIQMWHDQEHVGINATYGRLRERYYWPGMESDIQAHINECMTCSKRKQWQAKPTPQQRPISTLRPMECWALDVVGPLAITSHGNKYILTMCDLFTRWPEAVALPDQTASSIAKAIHSRIISNHGVPEKLLTDQGRNFESDLIYQLTELLGINKLRTTAYHPQTNGMCEKLNGTLTNLLSCVVNSEGNNWDDCLDMALWQYRTKPHAATGITPYEMLYGRKPRLIPDFYFKDRQSSPPFLDNSSYVELLKQRLDKLHKNTLDGALKRQLQVDNNSGYTTETLQPGEKVLIEKHKRNHKFDDRFEGPMEVVQQLDNQNVLLSKEGIPYRTHRGRIKRLPGRYTNNCVTGQEYDSLFAGGRGRR